MGGDLPAQHTPNPLGPDPYTRAPAAGSEAAGIEVDDEAQALHEAALEALGYVAVGRFPWALEHDTRDVERLVGERPLGFVDGGMFRLGCGLAPYRPSRGNEQRKIRAELERLHDRIPEAFDPRVRVLDTWLRTHLFAQRLDDIYRDFTGRLGVGPADFPTFVEEFGSEPWRGRGPFLGQAKPFTVLLFADRASAGRYTNRWTRHGIARHPFRDSFHHLDSLLFVTAEEYFDAPNDTRLHCHVAYNFAFNLVDGYKQYTQKIPAWWPCGIGLWYSRRVDPRYNDYERALGGEADARDAWKWEPKLYARVRTGSFTPARELCTRMGFEDFEFGDYMASWSRVAWLLDEFGDEGFRAYMDRIKEPAIRGARGMPSRELMLDHQARALAGAFGIQTFEEMDQRWAAWVLAGRGRPHEPGPIEPSTAPCSTSPLHEKSARSERVQK